MRALRPGTGYKGIMPEIAQNFEQIATRFSPIILIGLGLVCVIVGLFIWLGGFGFKKLLMCVIGSVGGGICGFFIIGRNIMAAALLGGFAAVIVIMFERIFITILAVALAAGLCFAILAKPYIENADHPRYTILYPTGPLSVRQTAETVQTYIPDITAEIRQAHLQMPTYNWVIIAAVAVIFILGGFFLWRLTSALCCSALGTVLIFGGMILLLLYKGADPISNIYNRTPFYAAVFTTMTTFGTIEQLLLYQHAKKKLPKKGNANNKEKEPNKRPSSWRTT